MFIINSLLESAPFNANRDLKIFESERPQMVKEHRLCDTIFSLELKAPLNGVHLNPPIQSFKVWRLNFKLLIEQAVLK